MPAKAIMATTSYTSIEQEQNPNYYGQRIHSNENFKIVDTENNEYN